MREVCAVIHEMLEAAGLASHDLSAHPHPLFCNHVALRQHIEHENTMALVQALEQRLREHRVTDPGRRHNEYLGHGRMLIVSRKDAKAQRIARIEGVKRFPCDPFASLRLCG